jgi:hypothetical protein
LFKKPVARNLIAQGKKMLKGDSSCFVAIVDNGCMADVSHLMTEVANLKLHHSCVVATMARPKNEDGLIDKRCDPYFEVRHCYYSPFLRLSFQAKHITTFSLFRETYYSLLVISPTSLT